MTTTDCEESRSALAPNVIDALLHLNRRLRQAEQLIDRAYQQALQELSGKACSLEDPMWDFEIDAEIDHVLREDDPAWQEDSDNILTCRLESMSKDGKRIRRGDVDFCESLPRYASIRDEPHCHLFHDLYDHSYGLDMPSLSLKDYTRVGSIWVDVIIRQQYFLDVASGNWSKSVPAQPTHPRGSGTFGNRENT